MPPRPVRQCRAGRPRGISDRVLQRLPNPPPVSEDLDALRNGHVIACLQVPKGVTPTPLSQATGQVRAYLKAHESPAALAAVTARPELKHPLDAQAFAAAALSEDKPSAALVAFLAAHDLTPHDPMPLVNAAGVLNALMLPREALAFLDAAAATHAPYANPMGFSGKAIALNNRGFALTSLGRWREAEGALRQAVQLEPRLAEANTNLARALSCQGKDREAVTYLRRGQRRNPTPPTATKDVVLDGDSGSGTPDAVGADTHPVRRPAASTFDVSAGVEGTLPDIDIPQDPQEAVANMPVYRAALQTYQGRIEAVNAKENALNAAIRKRKVNAATAQRTSDILGALYTVNDEPAIRALHDRVNRDEAEQAAIWGAFFTGEGDAAEVTHVYSNPRNVQGGAADHARPLAHRDGRPRDGHPALPQGIQPPPERPRGEPQRPQPARPRRAPHRAARGRPVLHQHRHGHCAGRAAGGDHPGSVRGR